MADEEIEAFAHLAGAAGPVIDADSDGLLYEAEADDPDQLDELPAPGQMGVLFEPGPASPPGPGMAFDGDPALYKAPDFAPHLPDWPPEDGRSEVALALLERAARGAGGAPTQALVRVTASGQEKHVVFTLAGTKYAVPMSQVLEVSELDGFTPVPNVPVWALGVTSLRGEIISVVDIRALLGSEAQAFAEARSLLVAQTFEGDITTGLVVERVAGIANISPAQIQIIETTAEDRLTYYVRGVYMHGNELLSVLNLESLLRSLEVAN